MAICAAAARTKSVLRTSSGQYSALPPLPRISIAVLLARHRVELGDDDGGAEACQGLGDLLAHPLPRARHHRHAAVQFHQFEHRSTPLGFIVLALHRTQGQALDDVFLREEEEQELGRQRDDRGGAP